MADITASMVKDLRQQTGAGMMDCKNALAEADGDIDKAVELLRVKLGKKVGKLADREAAEGTVQAYIHANGKVGVLVEVDCNTDFVARNDDFIAFAREIAMHIAASPTTKYLTYDEIPQEPRTPSARLRAAGRRQAGGHPAEDRRGHAQEVVQRGRRCCDQKHVNEDKHECKTIEQLRADLSAKTGENVVISRFSRFAVGE